MKDAIVVVWTHANHFAFVEEGFVKNSVIVSDPEWVHQIGYGDVANLTRPLVARLQ